jgi:hypothetical protein
MRRPVPAIFFLTIASTASAALPPTTLQTMMSTCDLSGAANAQPISSDV